MKASLYLLLLAIVFATGCSHTKDLTYQGIQGFSIQQGANPSMALDIKLYNPNRYNLILKDADVDVFVNGADLGKLQVDGKHLAPGRDTFLLPVSLKINPQVTLPDIMKMVMMGDVKIRLAGTMKGGRHGIYIFVPVNFEGSENLLNSMSR